MIGLAVAAGIAKPMPILPPDPVADARAVRIAELDEGQVRRVDLQQRQVRFLVLADDLGDIFLLVAQRHRDRIDRRALRARRDHVIVGNDIAVRRDQEARAERRALALDRRATLRTAAHAAEQLAERRARERVGLLLLDDRLLGRDVHDRGLEPRDHVGKAHRRAGLGHDRLDRAGFVLGDLAGTRSGAGLERERRGRAAEQ